MIIDNFNEILNRLTFESDFDRYIVHIIKRVKDEDERMYGASDTNRLIKTFYITSKEYLEKKKPVIKDLCESNRARAYILPQVRNNEDCLKQLLKIVVDNLSNPTIKPNHLIRSAYCAYHGSRDKKWILDLDSDNMTEYIQNGYSRNTERKIFEPVIEKTWTYDKVCELIGDCLEECGKNPFSIYMLNTKNGKCLVTPPFDLKKAYKKCSMIFQGVSKIRTGIEYTGPDESRDVFKEITGWLIKDGMALLYFNDSRK